MNRLNRPTTFTRRAFTVVELLIVIGIITVLISLLLPVVSQVRIRAQATDSANQIRSLTAACETYQQSLNQGYPGLFSNDQVATGNATMASSGGSVTMAENLVLSLLGGTTTPGGVLTYDATTIGKGPLNIPDGTRRDPFIDLKADWISAYATSQHFKDDNGTVMTTDSFVPEFVDRFSANPLPILYLRARKGAPGVMENVNGSPRLQYDLRTITAYTNTNTNTSIGIGGHTHGLTLLGEMSDTMTAGSSSAPALGTGRGYFKHPTLGGSDPNTGTPRAKDGFILISAGPDRIYGTADDIVSFGSVLP